MCRSGRNRPAVKKLLLLYICTCQCAPVHASLCLCIPKCSFQFIHHVAICAKAFVLSPCMPPIQIHPALHAWQQGLQPALAVKLALHFRLPAQQRTTPDSQGRLGLEANALVRKNLTWQKKAWGRNLCLLSAPVVICVFLLAIQRLIDNAINDSPEAKVGWGLRPGCNYSV